MKGGETMRGKKEVCFERGTSRMFLILTMEWLRPHFPTTSFRLMALRNRVECQYYNKTNIPPSYFESATKNNIFNFVLHQVRLILFDTNLSTKNNIPSMKTVLKTL